MASITAQRNELSAKVVADLENLFTDNGWEIYRTGSNMNTITFEAGEIEGKTVYGSVKFTLHKDVYNLDDEIEEFEMLLEEKKEKAKEKARRDAKAAKEKEARAAKQAERQAIEERKREKRKQYLEGVQAGNAE